jgi:Auxin binding protein
MEILSYDDLTRSNNSLEFEGADHGGAGVSFIVVDAAPGRGPSLHRHDYAEVFIVLEGQSTFRGPMARSRSAPGTWSSCPPANHTGSPRQRRARAR